AFGATVYMLFRRRNEPAAPTDQARHSELSGRESRRLYIGTLLFAAALFCYLASWTRMLKLVLGDFDATVAVVHGAFLLSLALGALWARKRIGSLSFAWIAALTGALALATLAGYGETFDVMQKSASTFAATSEGYLGFNLVKLLVAVAMIAPASFCGGVAYPLLTGSLQAQGHGVRAAGSVLGVASLGALIGALVAMHVLIPSVGFTGVVIAGAAVHISIGALAIVRSSLL